MPHNRFRSLYDEAERFQETLNHFRYDGVAEPKKSYPAMTRTVRKFLARLEALLKYEEKSLFPFLAIHFPRLEPLIRTLRAEHEDFRTLSRELLRDLGALQPAGGGRQTLIRKIRVESAQLSGLLASHLWVKRQKIYMALDRELKPHEKKLLARKIST